MAVCASNAMQGHEKQGRDMFKEEWVSRGIPTEDKGSFACEAEHGQPGRRRTGETLGCRILVVARRRPGEMVAIRESRAPE